MRGFRTADSDGASWRTIARRRQADLAFLETLRMAIATDDIGRLIMLAEHHENKHAPDWKRIAIARAIAKVTARAHAARTTSEGSRDP